MASTNTNIEWADVTWSPVTGCDKISAGCGLPRWEGDDVGGCYALALAKRLKAMEAQRISAGQLDPAKAKYQTDGNPRTSGPGFGVATHPATLTDPYGWRKPRRVFVNSMSDLFHAKVPLEFIQQVFAVIADTPQHTYQVLTKRASRAARLASKLDWPPNLWMGTSVENARVLHRVDDLRRVPAAVRFLSCEPLIGPLTGLDLDGIGWLISGGESGPHARPMHPDWVRALRDLCTASDVPFFHKQWGEWAPESVCTTERGASRAVYLEIDGSTRPADRGARGDAVTMQRNGRHRTGRLLDGREWSQFPATVGGAT